jgi:hypothetical protein
MAYATVETFPGKSPEVIDDSLIRFVRGERDTNTAVNDGYTGEVQPGESVRYLGRRADSGAFSRNAGEFVIWNLERVDMSIDPYPGTVQTQARATTEADVKERVRLLGWTGRHGWIRRYHDQITIVAYKLRPTFPAAHTSR